MAKRIPTNYAEARQFADEARDRAFQRVEHNRELEENHREVERQKPARSRREISTPFDVAVDQRLKTDGQYKSAIADNHWYIDYATMYAQGEMIELLREIVRLLTPQVRMRDRPPPRPRT